MAVDISNTLMAELDVRLLRAAAYLHTRLLQALNVPNSGVRVRGRTVYPDPSKPGEPPRKRTGWLQRNVTYHAVSTGKVRVGVTANARYGLWLELGTRKMAARPWLVATLRHHLPALQAILKGGGS